MQKQREHGNAKQPITTTTLRVTLSIQTQMLQEIKLQIWCDSMCLQHQNYDAKSHIFNVCSCTYYVIDNIISNL